MKKNKKFIAITMLVLVAACSSSSNFRESVGLRKRMPDEFKVVSNSPLVLPPEFVLRPPQPGAKGPAQVNIKEQAKNELFESYSKENSSNNVSKGETLFLQKAASGADADIRDVLAQEKLDAVRQEEKKGIMQK